MGGSNENGDPEWIGALVQRGAYASCHRWVPRHHLGNADLPVHLLSFVRPDEGLSVPHMEYPSKKSRFDQFRPRKIKERSRSIFGSLSPDCFTAIAEFA